LEVRPIDFNHEDCEGREGLGYVAAHGELAWRICRTTHLHIRCAWMPIAGEQEADRNTNHAHQQQHKHRWQRLFDHLARGCLRLHLQRRIKQFEQPHQQAKPTKQSHQQNGEIAKHANCDMHGQGVPVHADILCGHHVETRSTRVSAMSVMCSNEDARTARLYGKGSDNLSTYMPILLLGILLALLAILLWWMATRLRKSSGLPQGRVVYSDTGAWQRNPQTLFSKRHGLTGKPDYLVEQDNGAMIIPVEVKSAKAPTQPREGHVLQLAAYCLLVEENYQVRPTHGIIQYADKQFAIDYTTALETELLRVMADMRQALAHNDAPRNHHEAWRCKGCGVKESCDQVIE